MTTEVDPITTWLGTPDYGESPQDEPAPKAMSAEVAADDPARDPVGTIRVYDSSTPREDTGLAIRWAPPHDRDEQHP